MTQYTQPPQAPWPPYAPPPAAPKRKPFYKRKLVWLLGAIALIVIISVGTKGSPSTTATPGSPAGTAPSAASAPVAVEPPVAATPAAEPPVVATPDAEAPAAEPSVAPAPAEPGIGTSVRDGKFEFVVQRVDAAVSEIGDAPLSTTAQGQFILVSVSVTNIGDKPQSFFGSNTKGFDSQGREFSSSTEAAIYLPDSNALYKDINPGNSLDGKLVFDVPVGTQLTSIELHDSAFSDGVTVRL